MSWSASLTLKHEASPMGLQNDLEAINALVPTGQSYAQKECEEQCNAAKRAAFAIIVEGGFENAEEISVSLSGHANENHANNKSTNESVNVSVYIKKYKE